MSLSARWMSFGPDRKSSRRLGSKVGRFWAGRGSLVGCGPCAWLGRLLAPLPTPALPTRHLAPAAGQLRARQASSLYRTLNASGTGSISAYAQSARAQFAVALSWLGESNPVIRAQRKAGTGKGHPPIDPIDPKAINTHDVDLAITLPLLFNLHPLSTRPACCFPPCLAHQPSTLLLPRLLRFQHCSAFPQAGSPLIPRRTADKVVARPQKVCCLSLSSGETPRLSPTAHLSR